MRELVIEGPLLRKRGVKKGVLIGVDMLLILLSYGLATMFRYYLEGDRLSETLAILRTYQWEVLFSLGVLLLCQWIMKQYQSIWTLAGIEDFMLGTLAFMGGTIINLMISMLLPHRVPLLVTTLAGILAMLLCNGVRILWRIIRRMII